MLYLYSSHNYKFISANELTLERPSCRFKTDILLKINSLRPTYGMGNE